MKTQLSSQSGQSVLEAVLILVIFFGLVTYISNELQQNEVVANLVSGPWDSLAGLIQNGAWGTPEATSSLHPSHNANHITLIGDTP